MLDDDESMRIFDAVNGVACGLSAYDEIEYLGRLNDAVEEIDAAARAGAWPLLVELLRAWPPELYAQLLECLEVDPIAAVLGRINEDTASEELSLHAATPAVLMERLVRSR